MVVAWIVITLLIAVLVGFIAALASDDGFSFVIGFVATLQLSLAIAVIYVAAHFIGRYW